MKADEFTHLWAERAKEWVKLDGEAARLEKLEKIIFSEMVQRLEGSVAAREHAARASEEYRTHCLQMIAARTAANMARAEADGMRMKWDTWRTVNATRRAEMQIL